MPLINAAGNILFGFLALQNDFISREQLIAAVSVWLQDKSKPLDEILLQREALPEDEHALLGALVKKHLERHDNDAEKSLASVSSVGTSIRKELAQLGDEEVEASLGHLATGREDNDDPYATRTVALGDSTLRGERFRILRPHAKGGLGQVSVAWDGELNREVALKEIQAQHAEHSESRSRFILEAEITGGLEHPGIVPVYGLGSYADGRPFYAMRFIRGDSLKEAIEKYHRAEGKLDAGQRSLAFRKLLGRFIDVCNAVQYAHSRGVLHRDLKPGNIMLGKYGETLIVDWGLAKPLGKSDERSEERTFMPKSGSGSTPTQLGTVIGTPAYMSPEQAAGRLDELGPASDVYSLGATLYSVLTGQPPLRDRDVGDILQKVQRGEFPRPREVQAGVPVALEAVCLKAISLRPEDRYVRPDDLADDLERWLGDEPVTALPLRDWELAVRWARGHPITAAIALLTVIFALFVQIFYYTAMSFTPLFAEEGVVIDVLAIAAGLGGFLSTMAVVVHPRRYVGFGGMLFLLATLGLPCMAHLYLKTPGVSEVSRILGVESVPHILLVPLGLGTGLLLAGVFGGMSRWIAQRHMTDMLTVFFSGVFGAIALTIITFVCIGILMNLPFYMRLEENVANTWGGVLSQLMLIAIPITILVGFWLGTFTARFPKARVRPP